MLPQRLRTWIWRANGVLAVLVLAAGAWVISDHEASAVFEIPEPAHAEEPIGPQASVRFAELQALTRPFHGWGEREAAPRPAPVEAPPGLLPLRALACRAWIRYPDGPDLVVLKSKDPAHPETYLPLVGRPDRGVAIERIEPAGRLARISYNVSGRYCHPRLEDDVVDQAEAMVGSSVR